MLLKGANATAIALKANLNSPALVTPRLGTPASGDLTNCTGTASNLTAGAVTNGVYTTDKISALSPTTSTELAGVISDETGTGNLVFAISPTLVTPLLGIPASGDLKNCIGNASGLTAGACSGNALTATTVTNGVYTTDKISALSPTTSTELAGVISDETGTGNLVFAISPTLVTPELGIPASG